MCIRVNEKVNDDIKIVISLVFEGIGRNVIVRVLIITGKRDRGIELKWSEVDMFSILNELIFNTLIEEIGKWIRLRVDYVRM